MNKDGNMKLLAAIAVVLLVAAVVVFARSPASGGKGGSTPECKDHIDNDGDGAVDWPADAGCANKNDNDETNCGDGVCEGGETSATCSVDCGVPDSCADSDGGIVSGVQGTVSGFSAGVPYSNTDDCYSANSTMQLLEYYCVGSSWTAVSMGCGGNLTCVNGACV